MIERADQLVLEYVSRVADLCHGVLRTDQRLDFVRRLRARIEEERGGREDVASVRKVIARFGDPAVLIQRELQRLSDAEPEGVRPARGRPRGVAPARVPPRGPGGVTSAAGVAGDDFGDDDTAVIPVVIDDSPTMVSPPRRPLPSPRPPSPWPSSAGRPPRTGRPPPPVGRVPGPLMDRLRGAASGARATDGRDARTVLRNDRREVIGMGLLLLAGLLIPPPLPYVAIFPIPVLVWALGALTVLASEGWVFGDRLTGALAPVGAYVVGGVVLGAVRTPEAAGDGFQAFITAFFDVSGLMFMFGAVAGVLWLGYRLFNPPPPPPRRLPR
ncbi:hypothetical protein DQ384_35395 [Sphaerisporangium album]|uniref:Uncharacterized protein n=1 Tax=Sphaerisporangium album TaxID=509200 RepID=A0A367EWF7_9ACTN|nr:hypothetical protein [Sphaerisporangium album]RCG22413.1 hypothetical protein DQ384_35395 [Sphaerisporangium album]